MEAEGVDNVERPLRASSNASSSVRHIRMLQNLNYNNFLPIDAYDDTNIGPCKPGYAFNKWVANLKSITPLDLAIPETIIAEGGTFPTLKRIFYNDKTKSIDRELINVDNTASRDKFVGSCIERIVATAQPMTHKRVTILPGMHEQEHECLQDRIVGIIKRQYFPIKDKRALKIASSSEVVTPLPFQAQLLNMTDLNEGEVILQQYIKPKGAKPTVYRVFWKAVSLGVGLVTGWRITKNKEEFTAFNTEASVKYTGKQTQREKDLNKSNDKLEKGIFDDDGASSPAKAANTTPAVIILTADENVKVSDNDECDNDNNAKMNKLGNKEKDFLFLKYIRANLDMTTVERTRAERGSKALNKAVGSCFYCSLTDVKAEISSESALKLVIGRVSSEALENVRAMIERLVHWIQVQIQRTEYLVVHISSIVCDFIRDDSGKWWFIQVKGFQVSDVTKEKIRVWHSLKSRGLYTRVKGKSAEEILQKLSNERGFKCKMCGLNYQEGQVVLVEQHPIKQRENKDFETIRGCNTKHGHAGEGTHREVPAYGYILSTRNATRLSELYRDSKMMPLTKYARHLLHTFSISLEPKSITEKFKKYTAKSFIEINCCYFCFQIHEDQEKFVEFCKRTHYTLGILHPPDIADDTIANIEMPNGFNMELNEFSSTPLLNIYRGLKNTTGFNKKEIGDKIRLLTETNDNKISMRSSGMLSSADKRTSKSTKNVCRLLSPIMRPGTAPSPTRSRKPLPFTNEEFVERLADLDSGFVLGKYKAENFKPDTFQYRMLFIAYFISDLRLPPPMKGAIGCLAYSLGQGVHCMYFSTDPKQNFLLGKPLNSSSLWIKQCRLHFLCAQPHDAKKLFESKRVTFYLYLIPVANIMSEKLVPNEPELQGSISIGLDNLKWTTERCIDGSQKIDFLLPISLKCMGGKETVTIRLSIAVIKDDPLPWQLGEIFSFMKEKEVFWPPNYYSDYSTTPQTWISMLSSLDKHELTDAAIREKNEMEEKDASSFTPASNIENAEEVLLALEQSQGIIKGFEEIGTKDAVDQINEDDKLTYMSKYTKIAEMDEAAGKRILRSSFNQMLELWENRIGKLNDDGSVMSGTDDDNSSSMDDQQEIATYPLLEKILDDLKQSEVLSREAVALFTLAVEQILLVENLPFSLTWETLSRLLEECLPWAKLQRQMVYMTIFDNVAGYSGITNKKQLDESKVQEKNVIIGKEVKNSNNRNHMFSKFEEFLHVLSANFPNSELDFACTTNKGDSIVRKKRRMLYALSLCQEAVSEADTIDIVELQECLRLKHMQMKEVLNLVKVGSIDMPLVCDKFSEDKESFSMTSAIIATHMFVSSPLLLGLFDTYREKGVAFISTISFLRAVEECFDLVSYGTVPNYDNVLQEFKNLASEKKMLSNVYRNISSASVVAKMRDILHVDDDRVSLDDDDDNFNAVLKSSMKSSPGHVSKLGALSGARKMSSMSGHVSSTINTKNGGIPTVFLYCQMHGFEFFYLADLYCFECESQNNKGEIGKKHDDFL